jgi:hypothetical protein
VARGRSAKESRVEKDMSREEKRVFAALWFEEEMRNKIFMDARNCWQGFCFKLINGADE